MANYSSKDVAFILHSGYDLRGDLTNVGVKVDALTDDRMVLGDTWPAPNHKQERHDVCAAKASTTTPASSTRA